MTKIVELKTEETKAVVGGIKVSAPIAVGSPPTLVATSATAMRR